MAGALTAWPRHFTGLGAAVQTGQPAADFPIFLLLLAAHSACLPARIDARCAQRAATCAGWARSTSGCSERSGRSARARWHAGEVRSTVAAAVGSKGLCSWPARCSLSRLGVFAKVRNSTPCCPGTGYAMSTPLPRLPCASPAAAGAPSGCMWRATSRASCWSSCPAARRRASRVWRGERGGGRGKDG